MGSQARAGRSHCLTPATVAILLSLLYLSGGSNDRKNPTGGGARPQRQLCVEKTMMTMMAKAVARVTAGQHTDKCDDNNTLTIMIPLI